MTYLLKLSEAVIDDIVYKLQTNYPVRAESVNARFNDHVAIQAPLGIQSGGGAIDGSAYYRSGKWPVAENPAVLVVERYSLFTRDQEGPHGLMSEIYIRVILVDADQDREVLVKKLQRGRQAIIGALWDDPPVEKLPNSAWWIHPERTIPGPAEQEQQTDMWRSFCAIDWCCKQFETDNP